MCENIVLCTVALLVELQSGIIYTDMRDKRAGATLTNKTMEDALCSHTNMCLYIYMYLYTYMYRYIHICLHVSNVERLV